MSTTSQPHTFTSAADRVISQDRSVGGRCISAELLFALFGGETEPVVCSFIAAKANQGTTAFCWSLAGELAKSAEIHGQRVALVDAGAFFTEKSAPQRSAERLFAKENQPTVVYSWPLCDERPSSDRDHNLLRLGETIADLRRIFQFVVVDCPSTDNSLVAAKLCAQTDKTVLVVKSGSTRRAEIQAAQRVLLLGGASLVSCVLL